MNINFLKYRKIYYILSGVLALVSLGALIIFGLKLGIDFKGGTILELEFAKRPENPVIQEKLTEFDLGKITVQPAGKKDVILRFKNIDEKTHQEVISSLNEISTVEEIRFENIGPIISKEMRSKTLILIFFSVLAMFVYMVIAFREIPPPISGWQFGIVSIVTLFFDILIPLGLLAFLGKFYNVQFTIPIVTALLAILGYTMNDKVIVLDRTRENLLRTSKINFDELVNQSLNQVLSRSLSTGSCTLLVLLALFLFGGETLKYFSLILFVGILIGTYSSLFLASPILVTWLTRRWK
ncbi:MAG: protein translocase subunit SecF [Candidatus Paceibacterales bacterium]